MPLWITRANVEEMLRRDRGALFDALLERVTAGCGEIVSGRALGHPRVYLRAKDDQVRRPPGMFSSSALLPEAGRMGTRLLALGGPGSGGDGILILFDLQTLTCLAIINDHPIHSYRTGTSAALATRLSARPDARTIGVLGSSGIAEGTLAMTMHVRPSVERVRVFSPTAANRERFAEQLARITGRDVRAVDGADEAVLGADIVITATDADRPTVPDGAIAPGTHISAMGRNELELATLSRGRILLGTSLSFYRGLDPPWKEPLPEASIAGDLSEAVTGKIHLDWRADRITAFVSAGSLAMWDLAAASAVFDLAVRMGLGQHISLES